MSPEQQTFIITTVAGVLTLLITNYFANRKLQITLEQARLEQIRLEEAKLTELKVLREEDRLDRLADKQEILNAGNDRKNQIVKQVNQVRSVAVKAALKSEEAVRISNGFNEKITSTVEVAKEALEKLNNPNA